MGSYSQFAIGEIVFQWKYHVPTFLTFVFREDDVFIEREQVVLDSDDKDVLVDADELFVWKLDRLDRNLHHLVNTVHNLTARGLG